MTLGAAPLIGLVKVEDALAAPPPTVYDVTSYGAQGDGTTDDSNAIQAAIDAANARGGGTIVFPAGIFLVTPGADDLLEDRLPRRRHARDRDQESARRSAYPIIKSPGYDPPTGEPTPIYAWSLQNISLDGNQAGGALGNGIQSYATGFSMLNVSIFNCGDRGLVERASIRTTARRRHARGDAPERLGAPLHRRRDLLGRAQRLAVGQRRRLPVRAAGTTPGRRRRASRSATAATASRLELSTSGA